MNSQIKFMHYLRGAILLGITIIVLLVIDWFMPHNGLTHLLKEFIIVSVAAILVSGYFELRLRREISIENTKLFETREEYGKAGIVKYYSNFKDIDIRSYFKDNINTVEIYVNFAETVLNGLQDKISKYCEKKDVKLTIFMLSPNNKFISGLGELWGKTNDKYNQDGIRSKIQSSLKSLDTTFEELKKKGKLKAEIKIFLLERNPVFYSFYRFNDEMIYVPSKIAEPKSFIPLSFIVRKTGSGEGIFNKCMEEIELIKQEGNALSIYFEFKND